MSFVTWQFRRYAPFRAPPHGDDFSPDDGAPSTRTEVLVVSLGSPRMRERAPDWGGACHNRPWCRAAATREAATASSTGDSLAAWPALPQARARPDGAADGRLPRARGHRGRDRARDRRRGRRDPARAARRGAARAVNLELSPAYDAEARAARRARPAWRTAWSGGCTTSPPIPTPSSPPTSSSCTASSAATPTTSGCSAPPRHARRRLLVFSHPRRNLISRAGRRRREPRLPALRREFRVFAHPPEAMLAVLREHGLDPRFAERGSRGRRAGRPVSRAPRPRARRRRTGTRPPRSRRRRGCRGPPWMPVSCTTAWPRPRAISQPLTGTATTPAIAREKARLPQNSRSPRPAARAPGTSSMIGVVDDLHRRDAQGVGGERDRDDGGEREPGAQQRQARQRVAEEEGERDREHDGARGSRSRAPSRRSCRAPRRSRSRSGSAGWR